MIILFILIVIVALDCFNETAADKRSRETSEKKLYAELERKKNHLNGKILTLREQIDEQRKYLETLKQNLYNESGIPINK